MRGNTNLSSGTVRQKFVADTLKVNIGKRLFILLQPYPHAIMGKIVAVQSDFVILDVKPTQYSGMTAGLIHVKIEDIEAFYFEDEAYKPINKE
ncbi:hypothetical protein [Halalkalibacter krulwichiae]|uniref:Uncharacterized protein n=1 Tax=Halalkalibacter krulwichiae TaxID=199441 RepID=A0A1X9MGR2_9BACI|nr:hypothetical protein [Halalkalibacter krulwichiae]ARK31814.1 hypothetical protein BkAM31D_19315 [Halalkalibacter krulwichiae]